MTVPKIPSFEEYVASLGRLTAHVDPTAASSDALTDAVREIEEMADVRQPRQFIMAVIDGIGWKSRRADLRRIYRLWEGQEINGMYSLATLDQFRHGLQEAAQIHHLRRDR